MGIATLNALSSMCWDLMPEKDYEIKVGVDAFDELEVDPAKNSAVVGALVPILLLDIISEGGSGYHFFGKYAERIVVRKR
uniref:hypothetical protein n=1 Tax=Intestinibacter sp. TaxID=1965304 RepID=UPI002F41602A